MEPAAPDLQPVPEVMKGVPVPTPDSGCCRAAVTTMVAISVAGLTLGVLSGMCQEEDLGPQSRNHAKGHPKCQRADLPARARASSLQPAASQD